MVKFIVINVLAAIIYFAPVVYSEFSTHTCAYGNVGDPHTKFWKGSSTRIRDASRNALLNCEKNSPSPEKCFIVKCGKTFFAP